MNIVFEERTLHISKMGGVTGVIYFDFGADRQFPVMGWSDFVVVVTNWWFAAFRQLSPKCQEVELRFMDGPYCIDVTRQEESHLLLRCIEDRQGGGVIYEFVVERDELGRELQKLAKKVSVACSSAGLESSDLLELRKNALG